jgi:O-acetyl-ADP-ribose deacetylase (regulator of RNase III)
MDLPLSKARELLANGLNALSQRAAVSAEIVRASASEQLESLYADLAEMRRGEELDQTAKIRAIEVQARIVQQRVSLYGAQVKDADNDLQAALTDLLQRAHAADAEQVALPALDVVSESGNAGTPEATT